MLIMHFFFIPQVFAETIELPYTPRIPFQFVDSSGKLDGILYNLGEMIFKEAHVEKNWVDIPANRIKESLQQGDKPFCLVGWYKTPEREAIAQFSLPIYRDLPIVAVIQKKSNLKSITTLKELIDNRTLKLLIKEGYSYGNVIDQLIIGRKGINVESYTVPIVSLAEMVSLGRADFTFITGEEYEYYQTKRLPFFNTLDRITFSDAPKGNLRYIVCSRAVSDSTRAKLDRAIKKTIALKPEK